MDDAVLRANNHRERRPIYLGRDVPM